MRLKQGANPRRYQRLTSAPHSQSWRAGCRSVRRYWHESHTTMIDNAASTGTRSLLRRAGLPAAVVTAGTAVGALLLPYANVLVALLLPNALAIALLLTVAVINERRRVEARTQRAE